MEIDEIERDEVERNVPNGFHHQKIRQIDWTIRKRYTNIAIIGSGAFGCVCSAQDSENNEVNRRVGQRLLIVLDCSFWIV